LLAQNAYLVRDPDLETLRDVVRWLLLLERPAALRRVPLRLDVFVWGSGPSALQLADVALEGPAELAAVAPGILDEPLQVLVEVSSPLRRGPC
jgi:hypothetical protein